MKMKMSKKRLMSNNARAYTHTHTHADYDEQEEAASHIDVYAEQRHSASRASTRQSQRARVDNEHVHAVQRLWRMNTLAVCA